MQKQVTYCDLCEAADVADGYPTLTISGNRGITLRSAITSRNPIDLCDGCAESLVAWAKSRKEKPVAPVVDPQPAPQVTPDPVHVETDDPGSTHEG